MSRLARKRAIARIWPAKRYSKKIILTYHSIGNTPWGLNASLFAEQMQWLRDHCEVVALSELLQSPLSSAIQVAITFDDGYQNLYEHALPILARHRIRPMVYINTGWIAEEEKMRRRSDASLGHYPDESFLTWAEVRALYESGWEIGSHGVNHYNFTLTEPACTEQELSHSKSTIESRLNTVCLHFAYPWGKHTISLKERVKQAGYHYAAATLHGNVTSGVDTFALPRLNIEKDYTLSDFKNIIQGKWDFLRSVHKIRQLMGR